MNSFDRKSTSQRVSRLNVSPLEVDIHDPQQVGRAFFGLLYRVLRIGTIRDPEHQETQNAIDQLTELLEHIDAETSESRLSLEIRGELVRINGTPVELKPNELRRLRELRPIYDAAGIRAITIALDVDRVEIVQFLQQVRRVATSEYGDRLEATEVERITVEPGSTERSLERALRGISTLTYTGHLFARLVVKTRALHRRLQREPDADFEFAPFRRMLRETARLFEAARHEMLGLPVHNLLSASRATHSVHSAIYATYVALRAGAPPLRGAAIGAAILLEDVAALRGYRRASPEQARDIGLDEESAPSNITAADDGVRIADGSPGASLADVLLYERGGSRSETLGEPLYSTERAPHAAARLVDIVRYYDAEIQGRRGNERITPPQALGRVASAAGGALHGELASFFAKSMGRYPVGSCVRLSSGHAAIVTAPPASGAGSKRPTVRPFDRPERSVDLASPNWDSISIAESIDPPDDDSKPSPAAVLTHPLRN